MIRNLLSSFTGTMKSSLDSGSNNGTSGVSPSKGGKFKQLLFKIIGVSKNNKPVAYVRSGKEVAFEKVPFFNAQGEKLNVSTVNKNGQTRIIAKREGRISGVRKGISDPVTLRENMLSRNKGISQAIPKFHTRAQQHLKETQVLRAGIVSGELETPGNRNGRLLKKLKEEEKKEGILPSEAWLAQVRQHIGKKTASSGKDQLNAIAQAFKEHAKKGKKETFTKGDAKVELLDPTKPRIQKFQPQAIDPNTGKAIKADETKNSSGLKPNPLLNERSLKEGPQKTSSKVHYFDKTVANDMSATTVKTEKESSKVIGRITIEKREVPVEKPKLEAFGKSHDLLKKLKSTPSKHSSYPKMTGDDANLKTTTDKKEVLSTVAKKAQKQSAGLSQQKVTSPETQKQVVSETSSQPRTSESQVKSVAEQPISPIVTNEKPAATRRGRRRGKRVETFKGTSARKNYANRSADNDSLNSAKTFQSESKEVKPVEEAAQALKNMVHGNNGDSQSTVQKGASATQAASPTNQTLNSQTDLPKSIENLQEVLKKMETQAKILTGNGKTTIKVRLKPANLGSVIVHIRENGGKYDVAMRTETTDAARIIEHQVHQVKEQLSGQGIDVEKFVVDSGSEKNSSFQNQAEGQRESRTGRGAGQKGLNQNAGNNPNKEDEEQNPQRNKRLNVGTNTVDYVY